MVTDEQIIKALRAARRFVAEERKVMFDSFVVRYPPDPMFGKVEDANAKRYIAKADALVKSLEWAVNELQSRAEA